MPRAIWTGSISLGLVNVPVKLYSAIQEQDLHFTQLDPSGNRVRYKRVSEKTGREVEYEDIDKGYEVSKDHYVVIDPKELERFTPEATRMIEITDFVDLAEIDPIYYERTYYVAPASDGGARKAYELLLRAMQDQQRVGIGMVVMRNKQYLAAIRPLDKALALTTMLFADEVRAIGDIDEIPSRRASVAAKELEMAESIIDALTSSWDPNRYEDTYRKRVLEYIETKAKGEEIVTPERAEEPEKVTDLLAALEASIESVRQRKTPAKPASARRRSRKTTTAKKAGRTKKSAPRRTARKAG